MLPRLQSAKDIVDAMDKVNALDAIGRDVSDIYKFAVGLSDYYDDRPSKRRREQPSDDETDPNNFDAVIYEYDDLLESRYVLLNARANHPLVLEDDESPFSYMKLKITRSGCEFDGKIIDIPDEYISNAYENAAMSGFGNVSTQETDGDANIRAAREIPSHEFEVSPEMIEKIQSIWAKHFLPAKVRVEPYKIHLYGRGGQFRNHRDTLLEQDLAGIFLIGLYDDTTPSKCSINIEHLSRPTDYRSYLAFYPDVPHSLGDITDGYRAVIAFRLFRDDSPSINGAESAASESNISPYEDNLAKLRAAVETEVSQMIAPFGIHLSRFYTKSMTTPSVFDSILLDAARKRTDVHVHVLPVATSFHGHEEPDEHHCHVENSCVDAKVYPMTEAHLNFLLGDRKAIERDDSIAWLKDLKELIPFIWLDKGRISWSKKHESQNVSLRLEFDKAYIHDHYEVFCSYAMVVLPKIEGLQSEVEAI
ncbi:hypothetical protein C8Q75DRAFT_758089 [Abortiporus biennis]|nr:hypothetical protein C8Q75DRAFT_758089 [Abortiporus biennis]